MRHNRFVNADAKGRLPAAQALTFGAGYGQR